MRLVFWESKKMSVVISFYEIIWRKTFKTWNWSVLGSDVQVLCCLAYGISLAQQRAPMAAAVSSVCILSACIPVGMLAAMLVSSLYPGFSCKVNYFILQANFFTPEFLKYWEKNAWNRSSSTVFRRTSASNVCGSFLPVWTGPGPNRTSSKTESCVKPHFLSMKWNFSTTRGSGQSNYASGELSPSFLLGML